MVKITIFRYRRSCQRYPGSLVQDIPAFLSLFSILLALTADGLTQCRNTVFLGVGDLIILIFKLLQAKLTAENQYASLRIALSEAIRRQSWTVRQISFVTGSRSVNKQDLRKNLKFFQVPEASIESIRSKLVMRIFDE